MNDVARALADGWRRLRPRLLADPVELRRRLARRRAALLARPPRAWCLAVRANDTRLAPRLAAGAAAAVVAPEHVSSGHEITLTAGDLRALCAPVHLDRPGESIDDVARKLGVTRGSLLASRVGGVFATHHVRGLGGQFGKPRPLLYTPAPLDPAARGFVNDDPLWCSTAHLLRSRIPRRLRPQTLTRVPHFAPPDPRFGDTSHLHPEHPHRDPPPPARKRSLVLPPPPPDYVWYKWKAGEYLAHDWRSPLARANHERAEHRNEMNRAARSKRRREEGPALSERSASKGSLKFRGYRWLCPTCGRPTYVLFLPLPPIRFVELPKKLRVAGSQLRAEASAPSLATDNSILATPASFACELCHKLKRFSRCDPNVWNELVTYLSAGLLYGHEVPRPSWLAKSKRIDRMTPDERAAASESSPVTPSRRTAYSPRKIPHTPRPTRAPSRRRPQIERMLLAGRTFRQIATDLALVYGTILWHAQQVYKQHGVRSLPELLKKHGQTPRSTKREDVRRRMEAGQSIAEIASAMGISRMCVYNLLYVLRRAGKLAPSTYRTAKRVVRVHEKTPVLRTGAN